MDNEEKKVEDTPVVVPAEEPKAPQIDLQDQVRKLEEQKANLEKAVQESNETLRTNREAIKKATQGDVVEEIPKIDDTDPGAKAWNQRIKENTDPITSQLEKQKDEVRTFALRKFLADKPALAKNPEKLKELMSTYDRLKVATEQTQEGVLLDLEKAYGATFHEELIAAARQARVDAAKEDMIASDIAIDRGAGSEAAAKPTKRQYTSEERKIVEGWEANGAPVID